MTWRLNPDGSWSHRPWWKVLINTALRAAQTRRRPARLLVVYTKTTNDPPHPGGTPRAVGYGIGWVTHRC